MNIKDKIKGCGGFHWVALMPVAPGTDIGALSEKVFVTGRVVEHGYVKSCCRGQYDIDS